MDEGCDEIDGFVNGHNIIESNTKFCVVKNAAKFKKYNVVGTNEEYTF